MKCEYGCCRNRAAWMTGHGLLCTRHRNMFWRRYELDRLKMFKREAQRVSVRVEPEGPVRGPWRVNEWPKDGRGAR